MASGPDRLRTAEARRQLILDSAREKAENGGWPSVTTRSLALAIGYTQPVLYQHFPGGKSDIMRALALDGFATLTRAMRTALDSRTSDAAAGAVASAYLDFAAAHPAVYEAMFTLPIATTFADGDPEAELQDAFDLLLEALEQTPAACAPPAAGAPSAGSAPPASPDPETTAELFWSALHGLSTLERAGRLRPEARDERIHQLSVRFSSR